MAQAGSPLVIALSQPAERHCKRSNASLRVERSKKKPVSNAYRFSQYYQADHIWTAEVVCLPWILPLFIKPSY
jgi:hypothetical protein